MKFCVFLCFLFVDYSVCVERRAVRLPPEVTNKLIGVVQQCMAETRTPIETLMLIYEGGYNETKNFKEFLFCSYKKSGFLKSDSSLHVEKIKRLFKNDSEVSDGLSRCGSETGKNPKDALFKFYKCFVDSVPVKFVM